MVISAARERIRWLSTASSRRVSSSRTPYIAPEAPLIPTISRGLFCDSEEPDGFIYKYGPVALAFQGRNPSDDGGWMMSVTEHLDSLKAKHLDLEQLIEQEEARPRPDEVKIHELKRQKLRIKDEIAQLARH